MMKVLSLQEANDVTREEESRENRDQMAGQLIVWFSVCRLMRLFLFKSRKLQKVFAENKCLKNPRIDISTGTLLNAKMRSEEGMLFNNGVRGGVLRPALASRSVISLN
jgi:hypothetical protein